MRIFIITQAVDLDDSNLSFFHRWLQKMAEKADLVVVANRVGRHNLPKNVRVLSLGKEAGRGPIGRLFLFWRYARWYLGDSAGIFAHMCPEYVMAIWPWAKLKAKKILFWYTHKDVTWRLRCAEKMADKIFTASAESFRLNHKKAEIAGHGIDVDLFCPASAGSADPRQLLTVGRITPSKDLETMILAVKSLREDGFDVALDVVGAPFLTEDKFYFNNLKDLAANTGLSGVIKFLGARSNDDLPSIYRGHGTFLHASKTGSLDKAVLEAMASGLYVVSSSEAFRFLPELYRYHENDAVNLAAKVREIIETRPAAGLRDRILREHNLSNLTEKILTYFKT